MALATWSRLSTVSYSYREHVHTRTPAFAHQSIFPVNLFLDAILVIVRWLARQRDTSPLLEIRLAVKCSWLTPSCKAAIEQCAYCFRWLEPTRSRWSLREVSELLRQCQVIALIRTVTNECSSDGNLHVYLQSVSLSTPGLQ